MTPEYFLTDSWEVHRIASKSLTGSPSSAAVPCQDTSVSSIVGSMAREKISYDDALLLVMLVMADSLANVLKTGYEVRRPVVLASLGPLSSSRSERELRPTLANPCLPRAMMK